MTNIELWIGDDSNGDVQYYASGLDLAIGLPVVKHRCALPLEAFAQVAEECEKRRTSAYAAMFDVVFFNAYNGFGDTTGDDDYGMSVAWIDIRDYITSDGVNDVPSIAARDTDALSDWVSLHPAIKGRRWVLVYLESNGNKSLESYETKARMMADYRAFEGRYSAFLDKHDAEDE